MYKLFLGLLTLLLFTGCSSKEERALLKSYTEKTVYHKLLQKTEKTEFFENDNPIAILTATYEYTPNFEKNDTRDEVFIVGVAFLDPEVSRMRFDLNSTNDKDKNVILTNENEYILTLNHKSPTRVVPLQPNDKRLKSISFVTEWGDFYEVTYPHASKKFTLVFENRQYGKKVLHFAKVAKFIYTKKSF